MNIDITVDINGAQKHLRSENKKILREFQQQIKQSLGLAEGYMKQNVPVRTGFLKNSIHSEMIGKFAGQVYASVLYAKYANENAIKHERRNFIQKTRNFIEKHFNR